jgi:hypothetical protein
MQLPQWLRVGRPRDSVKHQGKRRSAAGEKLCALRKRLFRLEGDVAFRQHSNCPDLSISRLSRKTPRRSVEATGAITQAETASRTTVLRNPPDYRSALNKTTEDVRTRSTKLLGRRLNPRWRGLR